MKKIFYFLTLVSISSLSSCDNNDNNPSPSDATGGRIAVTTNNIQTKYGTFSSAMSISGNFKSHLSIGSFIVDGYNVDKKPTGMYFGATTMDEKLFDNVSSLYGKPLKVKLNETLIVDAPAVPYANLVNIENGLQNWEISKSKGLTLQWKIRNLIKSTPANPSPATRVPAALTPISALEPAEIDLPIQVPQSKTVVAIIPDDLRNTLGTSQYWVVDDNSLTFTITPEFLSMYGLDETVTIAIGTGTDFIYDMNGEIIDILSINTTSLQSIQMIQ